MNERSSLVKRLRECDDDGEANRYVGGICGEAADYIEELERRLGITHPTSEQDEPTRESEPFLPPELIAREALRQLEANLHFNAILTGSIKRADTDQDHPTSPA